jgi:hypothetical protein
LLLRYNNSLILAWTRCSTIAQTYSMCSGMPTRTGKRLVVEIF